MSLPSSPFLAACRGETPAVTPVWFMRQAGRSLPEYRALRAEHKFQELITNPMLAAEVTLQPVRRHGVDAAIFFSDIITSVQSFCDGVSIEPNRGPVIEAPFRSVGDVDRLKGFEPETHVPYVIEAVQRAVAELDPLGVPLIGFAGAPFTVATYLVEGGKSKEFEHTKYLMRAEPDTWRALMDALSEIAISTLRAQVNAGASAVQLFDSWAGILSKEDYRRFVLPWSSKVFSGLADLGVPRIHFGVGTGELLELMYAAGADVVGVDWRVSLVDARDRVGMTPALQGNLDPVALLGPPVVAEQAVQDVLDDAEKAGGSYIFNLGHGVLPSTDPATLTAVVAQVHRATQR